MVKFSLTKDEIIDIIAMGGAMIGSTLIALNIGLNQYGYMMFMVSGLASIYHLNHSNVRKSMKFNTWFYLVVDILGIIRYYGG
jgi:hypothetical protein